MDYQTPLTQAPPLYADSPSSVHSPHSGGSNPVSPLEHKGSQLVLHGLNSRSCVTCRRRKVKCDKSNPCSNCTKAQTQCVFPAPGRAPRRPREGGKPVSERETMLLKRLRRLESVVEELSGHSPPGEPSAAQSTGSHAGSTKKPHNTGVLVVGMDEVGKRSSFSGSSRSAPADGGMGALRIDEGKSKYVAHPFWAAITDEVEEIRGIIEGDNFLSDEDGLHTSTTKDTATDTSHQGFIMGYSSSNVNLKCLHPLPSQISFYWQMYLENIDPLIKITHTPTMNKVIRAVQSKLDLLSAGTEALMFSIYFAVIISMSPEDVRKNLGDDRDQLLKKYRFATEQALARAGFLTTNEIVTVQALVLFLVCVRRQDDSPVIWSLTALAIRIAQSLGLHRDGTKFGLSPFDTEMRRRLWWQVCILDVRAAEDHGSEPSIVNYMFDTELPLSLDDIDLDPEAVEPFIPKPGLSEMTFCLIRYQICILLRKLNHFPLGTASCPKAKVALSTEQKEKLIKDTADLIEKEYLVHCQNASGLYWAASIIVRLITSKMSLQIYQPFAKPGSPNIMSQDLRDRLFMSSIEIMEYTHVLKAEQSIKQWRWLFQTYAQWYCFAYILGELGIRESSTVVDRAWHVVEKESEDLHGVLSNSKTNVLGDMISKLMFKAKRKREQNTNKAPGHNYLGIKSDYLKPPLSGPKPPPGEEEERAGNMFMSQLSSSVMPSPDPFLPNTYNPATPVGTNSVDLYAPQNMIVPLSEMPWLANNNDLPDVDMQGTDITIDFNWDGWNEIIQAGGEMKNVPMGGMGGTWW
ncbi:fungal-specific transcription factor domain-containing protein [Calycina marina]|uniref:Fungal-specific transcription factor domain-containing protein n=1 Tax=Calycina marina TaxID=1763456 RepID=A0A9P7YWB7_9HELO|nr:fungal-specific transcription factor domain-containing protein [Calycina marina]